MYIFCLLIFHAGLERFLNSYINEAILSEVGTSLDS